MIAGALLGEPAAPGGQRLLGRPSARSVSAAPMRGTSCTVSPVGGIVDGERLARVGLELEQGQIGHRGHPGS